MHLPGNKAEQHQQRSEHNASAAEPEGSDPEELQAGEVFPGEGMHFPHATPTARALQLVHFCFFFCLFNEKGYFTQATDKTTPPDVLHVHSWSFKEVARSSRAALT